jgi:hypothetical protein
MALSAEMMEFVALVKKKIGEIAAVLASDAGDVGFFHEIEVCWNQLAVDAETDRHTPKINHRFHPMPSTKRM